MARFCAGSPSGTVRLWAARRGEASKECARLLRMTEPARHTDALDWDGARDWGPSA